MATRAYAKRPEGGSEGVCVSGCGAVTKGLFNVARVNTERGLLKKAGVLSPALSFANLLAIDAVATITAAAFFTTAALVTIACSS